jgi:hypothetical protein
VGLRLDEIQGWSRGDHAGNRSMGASISKTWGEISADFFAGVDSVVNIYNGLVSKAQAGTDKLAAAFDFSPRELWNKALAKASSVVSDFFASTMADAQAGSTSSVRSSLSHRVRCEPLAKASSVVSEFFVSTIADAQAGIDTLRAKFGFSPSEVMSKALQLRAMSSVISSLAHRPKLLPVWTRSRRSSVGRRCRRLPAPGVR